MPSVVISEGFMTISAIIIATLLTATIVNNIHQIQNMQSIVTMSMKEKMGTKFSIVFTSIENDTVRVWLKNIGTLRVSSDLVGRGDLYFGPTGSEKYIPFNSSSRPLWNYTLVGDYDGDGYIDPGETVEIVIYYDSTLSQGDYHVRYVVYTGYSTDYYISL